MTHLEARIDALHTKADIRWEYQKEWVEKILKRQREGGQWMDRVSSGLIGLAIVAMAMGAFVPKRNRTGEQESKA
ncbi:hypothetical protein BKA63DRAFT_570528 [Paraphoma chrysanthemicola]|nr:hypothetical protein BKA63DRAFT_570528 [Paraphoma chrysanthemicola]